MRTFQKMPVQFSYQAEAYGQGIEPAKAILQRNNIVVDLLHIGFAVRLVRFGFEEEEIFHPSLRTFDSGAENGFAANGRPDQMVWVGKHPPEPCKLPQS